MTWFRISNIDEKLASLEAAVALGMGQTSRTATIGEIGRDIRVERIEDLPPKPKFSSTEGQARLLHDLANIELQATELAVRSLYEYPEAPREFREQLADLATSEGRHLKLCLDRLRSLGFQWGDWPAHLSLWNAVHADDSLVDRILIVHRYLEGSGLDAGESILRRLVGVDRSPARDVVETIVREEVDHVAFGSRWYRHVALELGLDPEHEFAVRLERIAKLAPRRERVAHELRRRAGFTDQEIAVVERVAGSVGLEKPKLKLLGFAEEPPASFGQ